MDGDYFRKTTSTNKERHFLIKEASSSPSIETLLDEDGNILTDENNDRLLAS